MKLLITPILLILPFFLYASSLEDAKKAGLKLGKETNSKSWEEISNIKIDELKPFEQKGETFEARSAKDQLRKQNIPSTEVSNLLVEEVQQNLNENSLLDPNDYFLKKSEEIYQKTDHHLEKVIGENSEYVLEKCFETGTPFPLHIVKSLSVSVHSHPEIKKSVKVCSGHWRTKECYWKGDAKKDAKKQEAQLSADSTIKRYRVKIKKGGGALKNYKVKSSWSHRDDAPTCTASQLQEKKIQDARIEEEDKWLVDQGNELVNSPQCTYINKECLEEASTRQIEGKEVFRQCWKEQFNYICKYERKKGCEFLASSNCSLVSKKCLESSAFGCSLWELTYRCISDVKKSISDLKPSTVFGSNQDEWETAYVPNTSFSNIYTTMNVFEAIKQDMENSQLVDSNQLQIFKGNAFKCSKAIAADLTYDCCFSFGGLLSNLKLSHCSADEIALSDMRDKGLCYYLGFTEEKILDLWTSRKDHIFCCYSTKLARVFQEQAHDQLGIKWGSPKHPDCRGLNIDEISKLDFTKLNLSEAYEKLPMTDMLDQQHEESKLKEKTDSLEKRFKEKMAEL
ncbi:MAG: conjugal transfer protein TraN [Parachlamydia sp.]|nr:MAG: conjugal transfer protein TraN [Parachlamydia sp.]